MQVAPPRGGLIARNVVETGLDAELQVLRFSELRCRSADRQGVTSSNLDIRTAGIGCTGLTHFPLRLATVKQDDARIYLTRHVAKLAEHDCRLVAVLYDSVEGKLSDYVVQFDRLTVHEQGAPRS